MKKYFMLAAMALIVASCSNETTEDLNVSFTRAEAGSNGCNKRTECKFAQEGKTGTHYHCDNQSCEYYNGYVTDLQSEEAQKHNASAQAYKDRTSSHHGGYVIVD